MQQQQQCSNNPVVVVVVVLPTQLLKSPQWVRNATIAFFFPEEFHNLPNEAPLPAAVVVVVVVAVLVVDVVGGGRRGGGISYRC